MKMIDISNVMPTVTAVARKTMRITEKNLPTILAGGGIGCLCGAVVMAAVGMHKADQKIADEVKRREETVPEYNNKELTVKDKVRLTWMEFVPAAVFTTAAVALIIASERKGHEKYMAVLGAYELSKQALNERKEAENDVLSDDDVKLVNERVKAIKASSVDIPDKSLIAHVTNDGDETLYIESVTKTPFYAKEAHVLHAFNVMNHRLNIEDRACVSDILDDLELRTSRASDAFVWTNDRYGEIVEPLFNATFVDNDPALPATLIEYSIDPDIER